MARTARGALFFVVWLPYMLLLAAPIQRLLVWPLVTILPSRRASLMNAWMRLQANVIVVLTRTVAGVKLSVRGSLPAEAVVAVMNHQSVLDIPVAVTLFNGPGPLFPTRDRYRWRIPFISPFLRLARFPFITQRPSGLKDDLESLGDAADRVACGENSLLIYAEGHRTRDGEIGRFMRTGPRLILSQSRRPVYTIVADGMWGARTFTDALAELGHSRVDIVISGPYDPPAPENADQFLDQLREDMVATLASMRRESAS